MKETKDDHSIQDLLDRLAEEALQPEIVLQPQEVTTFTISRNFRDKDRNYYLRVSLAIKRAVNWPRGTIVRYNDDHYGFSEMNLAVVSVSNYVPELSNAYFVARLRQLTPEQIERLSHPG